MESIPENFTFDLGAPVEAALVLSFLLIMFGVGLSLTRESFAFLKRKPRLYVAGVFSQLVALPAITVVLCNLLSVSGAVGLGMIMVACCPGGVVSNLFTLFSRGNMGLSVALTATSSLAAAVLTPALTLFWANLYAPTAAVMEALEIDAVEFLVQIGLTLALPLVLGVIVRARYPSWAGQRMKRIALAGGVLLGSIVVLNFFRFVEPFLALGLGILGVVVLHNALAFATGYGIAKSVAADEASARAITIETGIQNAGLAILIVLTQFQGLGGAFAVIGLWGTWHIVGGLALTTWWRRRELSPSAG